MKINSEISELIINPQGKDAEDYLMRLKQKSFHLMMRQAENLLIFKNWMN